MTVVSQATPGSTFDVFISYHSADKPWVEKLKAELLGRGVKVWVDFDQVLPGDRFAEALERGIQASRCVALVVSSGSLQSEWVKEEYYRALGLANTPGRQARLIPVLIESVSVPGFLSSRSWADFRDPEKFQENVERLCRAIAVTEHPDDLPQDADRPATPFTSDRDVDEVTVLERSLQRAARTAHQLQWTRFASPVPGFLAFAVLWSLDPEIVGSSPVPLVIVAPLTTALLGWGVTAPSLSKCKLDLERLTCLKDGLELCRTRANPACEKLRIEFWRVLHRNAGVDSV